MEGDFFLRGEQYCYHFFNNRQTHALITTLTAPFFHEHESHVAPFDSLGNAGEPG